MGSLRQKLTMNFVVDSPLPFFTCKLWYFGIVLTSRESFVSLHESIMMNYASIARLENERLQHALAQLCGCPSSFWRGLRHFINCLENFHIWAIWHWLFYVKRKVESIREDHSSIPSLLFRWTQQSDEWQKPQHGTQAARSGVTNRSGSMAEDMVTMLASLVEEVLSILLFFSMWRVWKLWPLAHDLSNCTPWNW